MAEPPHSKVGAARPVKPFGVQKTHFGRRALHEMGLAAAYELDYFEAVACGDLGRFPFGFG
jgi:hypothetical protein